MGMSRHLKIGVYVECYIKQIQQIKKIKSCDNIDCPKFSKETINTILDSFCSSCGNAIKQVDYKFVGDSVNMWQVDAALNEAFYCSQIEDKTRHIWLPNKGYNSLVKLVDSTDSFILNLTSFDFNDEFTRFHDTFERELDVFDKFYGYGNVHTRFGAIQYYW